MSRSAEELERALAAAEGRAAELQAWSDSAQEEAEALRARVAELEARPPKEDPRVAELQAWIDSGEEESGGLRVRIAELEARSPPKQDGRVTELQAWIDSEEEELGALRARIAELEAQAPDRRMAELQSWLDAAEQEAKELRTRAGDAETDLARAKERLSLLGDSVGGGTQLATENRQLVARVSELEAVNHSLRALSQQLAGRVEGAARRDVQQLEAQLEDARGSGVGTRVAELEGALGTAREAVATLQAQREAAVDQVRRYVEGDAQTERAHEKKEREEHAEAEREHAALEAQLAERSDELAVLLKAHATAEQTLEADVKTLRERACAAEQSLGSLQSELEVLRDDKGTLEARSLELARKLEETQGWLSQGELDTAELKRQLDAAKTEGAVNTPAEPLPVARVPPPPPAESKEAAAHELEGFSPQHLHRLEALLALEQVKSGQLAAFAQTAETSLRRMQDELDAAGGRLADLRKRLGLADAETGETFVRLEAARREVHALFTELARAREPQPDEGELVEAEEVLEAPLAALEELAAQQASATQEATQALAGEQRAREQLVGDLTWLKAELEKLSNVRQELRAHIGAMVQRELKRKQVVSALLDKLRSTEVASAARAGTLRRLHAALEKAQAIAVRAQTVYFQKQIGSLQRQLEKSQKSFSLSPRAGRGSG